MKTQENNSTDNLSRFAKDKRSRTVRTERVERESRHSFGDDEKSASYRSGERRSFNPNFDENNRPKRDFSASSDRKPYGERKQYGDKPSFGGDRKPYGERKQYGDKPSFSGDHKSYGERKQYGDKPSFGGDRKPYGERKQYGDKPAYGEHKQYGDKPSFSGDHKSYGERKQYGDKPAYGERKQYGDKPSFGGDRKPYGERKQYGDKPAYGERKQYGERPAYGRNGGFVKRDDKPKAYPKYSPDKQTGAIRLNRYIAQSGLCSRREADDFITAGVVSVNGVIVTELGSKVQPTDEVRFNNEPVQGEHKVYLVLNKPKGYVTSIEDPHADKLVMDLVRNACTERIYPVGRLDKNSLGLLLFTNDGDLTKQLTHPSYMKKKIYQVSLDKALTRADMDTLTEGITLEDGDIFCDEISYIKENKAEVGVEIHSGRNRIVRRMFESLGYKVEKLDRVYYAGLTKKNLKRGAWRFLSPDEVSHLKSGQYE